MGKVFETHTKYDPYPGQYSFENWNRAVANAEPNTKCILNGLVKGNFYRFMNVLLDFEYIKEINMYGPKKERRFGAKRN